jgi:hypothetical protein
MIVRFTLHIEHAVFLLKADPARHRNTHFALGALDIDLVWGDGDFYAGGQWNWFVSYA